MSVNRFCHKLRFSIVVHDRQSSFTCIILSLFRVASCISIYTSHYWVITTQLCALSLHSAQYISIFNTFRLFVSCIFHILSKPKVLIAYFLLFCISFWYRFKLSISTLCLLHSSIASTTTNCESLSFKDERSWLFYFNISI